MVANGLVLESTDSLEGGVFLPIVDQRSQQLPTSLVDHAFVFRIIDEEGTVYYHWEVRSLQNIYTRLINMMVLDNL